MKATQLLNFDSHMNEATRWQRRSLALRLCRKFGASWMLAIAWLLVITGCACDSTFQLTDRHCVSSQLEDRFGHPLSPAVCPRDVVMPNGLSLAEELSEEEAVLIALWNNAAFLEALADLGMAQGDLVQAGLLPNPDVVFFFSANDKPFKYLIDFPLEALWLRPIRVAAAEQEAERVTQRLTQAGLDLMRDTRQAHSDLILAYDRKQVAADVVKLRGQIASLAQKRLDAGDISPQEASTALIDSYRAEQDATRADFDIALAETRLRNLLGLPSDLPTIRPQRSDVTYPEISEVELLIDEAHASRPDALAAAQAAEAATARLYLAQQSWLRVLGILDATSGRNGHEFGPAFRTTLPLFHRNHGTIARAEAELEKAERQRQTVHNQITLDIKQAHLRLAQAQAEKQVLSERVLPEVELAIKRSETAYLEGNTPYVIVLQTTQQLIDSRFREVQLRADERRAWSDLERSVGRHLGDLQNITPETISSPTLTTQHKDQSP